MLRYAQVSGRCRLGRCRSAGFSLLELAIVLLVISILTAGALRLLGTMNQNRQQDETRQRLDIARIAVLDYVALYGQLPCPASAASAGQPDVDAQGHCTHPYDGFLPAAALGISGVDGQGFIADAWGQTANRVRYAVAVNAFSGAVSCLSAPGSNYAGLWTANRQASPNLASNFYQATPLLPELCVCSTASCSPSATWLAPGVAVVLYSTGGNALAGGKSKDEAQNPNQNGGSADRIFVYHAPTMAGTIGGEFDDQMTWISSAEIYGRMLMAGRLP
ncbi:type II secretion system protein [Leeia oryzae]|uniref:type II secretion system protein n=1 Tax=Leeia oryzae TaxID=356662 RepID=UPI00037950B8|nr:type II secretion system protein [Leeia oryzae]